MAIFGRQADIPIALPLAFVHGVTIAAASIQINIVLGLMRSLVQKYVGIVSMATPSV